MKPTETEVRTPETKLSKEGKEMLLFVTQYQPLVSTVKEALIKEPPLISYKKGKPWQRTYLLEPKY